MKHQKKPNIILIYTDQQRYDTIGVNGNPLIHTPNLDKMTKEGVQFSRGYVTTPVCVPSRIELFTSNYNHAKYYRANDVLMVDREKDLVSLLRSSGYRTGLSGKDHCFGELEKRAFDWAWHAGHHGFRNPSSDTECEINEYRKDKMMVPFCEDPFPAEQNITAKVFERGKEFIEQSKEEPFFLWLSFPDPHPPYMVSEPYASMYEDVDIPLPVWQEGEMDNKPYRQQKVVQWNAYEKQYPTRDDIARLKRIYWGQVSCIDHYIGKLLDYLKANDLDEDTIIVFTSDHGDYMGDHRMIRKGPHVYEALTHVPLIFYWPGKFKTRCTNAMVSNVDIMPTLCELAGIDIPHRIHGESFAKVLYGTEDKHRDAIFMQHGGSGQILNPGVLSPEEENKVKNKPHHLCDETIRGKTKGVRTEKWKYCITPGNVDELYDLEADPFELCNLADNPKYKDVISEHRHLILKWMIETEDTLEADKI